MFRCIAARKVEESIKTPATTTANVVPPVLAEERVKKREVEVEDTKRKEDAMDVEQPPVQPPLTKHANEHLPDLPTPTFTDRNETEGVSHPS